MKYHEGKARSHIHEQERYRTLLFCLKGRRNPDKQESSSDQTIHLNLSALKKIKRKLREYNAEYDWLVEKWTGIKLSSALLSHKNEAREWMFCHETWFRPSGHFVDSWLWSKYIRVCTTLWHFSSTSQKVRTARPKLCASCASGKPEIIRHWYHSTATILRNASCRVDLIKL